MGLIEGNEREPLRSGRDRCGTPLLDETGKIPESAVMTRGPEARVARSGDDSRLEPDRPSPRGGNPAEMVNALDALRVACTFFVLLYHAALTYMATPLRLTTWATYDASHHVAFDYFIYW